jgi:hypothetical protein
LGDEFVDELDLPINETLDKEIGQVVRYNEQRHKRNDRHPPGSEKDQIGHCTNQCNGERIKNSDLVGRNILGIKHGMKIANSK